MVDNDKRVSCRLGEKYGIDPDRLAATLQKTVFKAEMSKEEMAAALVMCEQYGLNPFAKHIYIIKARDGQLLPIVSIDGWVAIVNSHPQMAGFQLLVDRENKSCTCRMYRKDWKVPSEVTEFADEIAGNSPTWKNYLWRMLRKAAYIQCARLTFGFSGIYDYDEARRIDPVAVEDVPVEFRQEGKDVGGAPQDASDQVLEGETEGDRVAQAFGMGVEEDLELE